MTLSEPPLATAEAKRRLPPITRIVDEDLRAGGFQPIMEAPEYF